MKNKNSIKNKIVILVGLIMVSTSIRAQEVKKSSMPLKNQIILLGGDPDKVPLQEDPGPDAEIKELVLHSKIIEVDSKELSFKWTSLGYGIKTEKVIIPKLANHTLFNHRNPGEVGPCLRSDRQEFSFDSDGEFSEAESLNISSTVLIKIEVLNQYEINQAKKICRVNMVENVETLIDGVRFYHKYTKPMGFRYIEDCQ